MVQTVFIDLQGFKGNSNNFIAKEIAIVFNSKEYMNFIIKPPFKYEHLTPEKQKQVNWLSKNYHHLLWEDGSITFKSVLNFLRENTLDAQIFVKGAEKKMWTEKILQKNVLNVEDIFYKSSITKLEKEYSVHTYCNAHNHGTCALKNALLLQKALHFNKNKKSI